MFFLKSKYPHYYSYQGRKISKKISLSKKKLISNLYDQFSIDQEIIEYHNSQVIRNKIRIPENYKKVNIEIGFGNGEFLTKSAISRPDELFIGIEVYVNGIASVLKKISTCDIKNISLSNLNSFYFLDAILPKSIDKIFIINPDPWKKKRHHKRRLMSYKIIKLLRKVIKSKNSIYMTTDSECYLKDTKDLLSENEDYFGSYIQNTLTDKDELYGISRYQRKAIENGGKIYLLIF